MPLTPSSLAEVMGDVPGVDYNALFEPMVEAMIAASVTTHLRAAAWFSQLGHESGGLKHTAEIQRSHPSWSADRTRYRGRGYIQLTWEGNYRRFGIWCRDSGFVDDSEIFVKAPELVEQPKWGLLASSWYWLFGGPKPGRINEFADAADLLRVSACVNGWLPQNSPVPDEANGYQDRERYYNRARSMGDAIVPGKRETPMGFTGDPLFLEDVLRADLGDRLVVEEGWSERGTGGQMGEIWGVMIHHTGNVNETVGNIANGVQQPGGFLPGPLSQCLIKPDGTCHLVAVGPCNHAGAGEYGSLRNGNRDAIGLECAYSGSGLWPQKQIITMRDVTAAILKHLELPHTRVCGHKEYARPIGRKPDPGNMDMNWFRGEVKLDMEGHVFPGEPLTSIPEVKPTPVDYEYETYVQTRGRFEMLGWRTQVEALAVLLDKALGTENAGKPGIRFN